MQQPSDTTTDAIPGQGGLGSALLVTAAAIAVLAFIDRTSALPFEMPRSWYSHRIMWYLFAFLSLLGGVFLLKSKPEAPSRWRPQKPGRRFERLVVYSRPECHLCDQAKDTLWAHARWLPEIEEINIDDDPHLQEQFGDQIPVVELDGEVRFRGQVNQILLRRLIDGTPPAKRDPATVRPIQPQNEQP